MGLSDLMQKSQKESGAGSAAPSIGYNIVLSEQGYMPSVNLVSYIVYVNSAH